MTRFGPPSPAPGLLLFALFRLGAGVLATHFIVLEFRGAPDDRVAAALYASLTFVCGVGGCLLLVDVVFASCAHAHFAGTGPACGHGLIRPGHLAACSRRWPVAHAYRMPAECPATAGWIAPTRRTSTSFARSPPDRPPGHDEICGVHRLCHARVHRAWR